ncbi:ATP-dependent DNA helicase DinG [Thermolongibacillus altinsuensis]|uniref:3'-5' exonuclease DinG n=1 Tax=Thermolongibacillus altinsuensis TaxID=575256 RepID=A0A4R1QKK6_9BACL|nr:ATP-dependent DNA helicase DinG [Thermolongibacillus altinsuensis]TCL53211.1 ATP-dependent DNA helicase DinG [Thermolongibacillus altinsuensis]
MNGRFVVVDLETTGNTPKKGDRIIQIGFVVIERKKIVKRFSSFINPERDIPPFIQQLTGIDETMLSGAPSFDEIAPILFKQLNGAYFVAHNVHFDWSFLQEEFSRIGMDVPSCPMIDTVELARMLMPTEASYKLTDLASLLSVEHERPHQADSDAEVTAELLLHLLDKLASLPLVTLQQLRVHAKALKSDLLALLDEAIAKKERSLERDDRFDEYEGLALKKQEKPSRQTLTEPLPTFSQFFADQKAFPFAHYEHRDGQWEMMEHVDRALHTCQHALIEAGTGIGKSLAYLLPAVFFAKKQKRPLVISTHTLQLQKQLLERDLPLLARIVPFSFTAAVLKGRRNYLSLRKFARTLHEMDENYDVAFTKCQLLVWLTETETGDVDELNLTAGGKLFWEEVQSEGASIDPNDFFMRAKQKAQTADLIITNHAFLLHDLTADEQALPPYSELVIDEAHHLEEVAAHFFGQQVDYAYVRLLWTRMNEIAAKWHMTEMRSLLADLEYELSELFRMIRSYALHRQQSATRVRYRFTPFKEYGREWNALVELTMRLASDVRRLETMIERIDEEDAAPFHAFVSTFTTLRHLLLSDDDAVVRWMEVEPKGAVNAVTLYAQPIDLAAFFADQLFARKKSVILTSATLTMNGSFAYIISRLGLEDFYPMAHIIPSPFRYEEQALLMVPSDLPSLTVASLEEYAEAVARQLLQIAYHTKGRMLVLFTSYELLKLTHSFAKQLNDDEAFVLMAQGVSGGNAAKLTRNFQQFEQAILFGTSSFWEGIDIPGDDLSCLVIVRLPFAPPDDPVIEAKSEHIRAKGGNPFYDLALPQAVLRFKQGFGRLIRTKSDRGVMFVFDRRMMTASYGKYFLQSLPPIRVYEEPLDQLLPRLDQWL